MPPDYSTVYRILDELGIRIDRGVKVNVLMEHFRNDRRILRKLQEIAKHDEEVKRLLNEIRKEAEPK